MNKALDKAKKEEWSNDVDDEDPGIIFVLWPSDMGATAVHQCLSLPAVAHLDPPLQQGATNEQSVANLYNWLDTVVSKWGYADSMVRSPNGRRIPGLYHKMKKEDANTLKSKLENLTTQWLKECLNNHYSAGYALEVTGKSGTGSLLMGPMNIGPFIYTY